MKHDRDKLRAALAKLEASRDLREAAKDPANGIIRREYEGKVQFIITGVPRSDGENDPPVKRDQAVVDYVVDFAVNHVVPNPPPPVHPDQPPTDFYISISEWEICQASYEVRADCVIVTRGDEAVGTDQLRPDEDPLMVAKRLLKKSRNQDTGFGRRLDYPDLGIA